jgi:hypothetical protein
MKKPSEIIGERATKIAFNGEITPGDYAVAIVEYLDSQYEAGQKMQYVGDSGGSIPSRAGDGDSNLKFSIKEESTFIEGYAKSKGIDITK